MHILNVLMLVQPYRHLLSHSGHIVHLSYDRTTSTTTNGNTTERLQYRWTATKDTTNYRYIILAMDLPPLLAMAE